ncbi:unnamed protein product, partial [marine sediment metagenome]
MKRITTVVLIIGLGLGFLYLLARRFQPKLGSVLFIIRDAQTEVSIPDA